MRLASSRRHGRGFTLIELLVVIIIMGILTAIAVSAFSAARDQAYTATEQTQDDAHTWSDTTTTSEPAEYRSSDVGAGPVIAAVLLGLVGLGAVGTTVGVVGGKLVRRRRLRLELRKTVESRWLAAISVHDVVADEYADYRLDPVRAIEHIALWDISDKFTAAFTTAYAKCGDLRSAHLGGVPLNDTLVDDYVAAVAAARESWDAARTNAVRVGMERLEKAERVTAGRALKLLKTAADTAASDSERALAAAKAQELLATFRSVVLPTEMTFALEAATRKELTTV